MMFLILVPLFFAIPLLLVAVIVILVWRGIQFKYEARSIFTGEIDRFRAELLKEIFGIEEDELRLLHFDGQHFCPAQAKRNFSEVTSIQHVDSKKIAIVNPNLSHWDQWRYSRIDGGPDRRYNNNVKTMYSARHRFRLNGDAPIEIAAFTYPAFLDDYRAKFDRTLSKYNRFLALGRVCDLNLFFSEFRNRSIRLASLESALSRQANAGNLGSPEVLRLREEIADAKRHVSDLTLKLKGMEQECRRRALE